MFKVPDFVHEVFDKVCLIIADVVVMFLSPVTDLRADILRLFRSPTLSLSGLVHDLFLLVTGETGFIISIESEASALARPAQAHHRLVDIIQVADSQLLYFILALRLI